MSLESIYRCLDTALDPQSLMQALVAEIANLFEVELIYLDFELPPTTTLTEGWSEIPEVNWSRFTRRSEHSCIYTELEKTPYRHLVEQGIQQVAHLPIPNYGVHRGWLWLGTTSTLPDPTVIQTVLSPLKFALEILALKMQEQRHQRHNELLAQINHLVDSENNTSKLLQQAIAATTEFFQAEEGIVGLLKYEDPLHFRQDHKICPVATLTIVQEIAILPDQWTLKDCDFCQQAWLSAPKAWAIEDMAQQSWHSPLLIPKYRSLLIAPLMGNKASDSYSNTVLGFLICAQQTPRTWRSEETQLFEFIAHQLSTAMIHHRALRQVQSLVDERTAQLKWSLDVQAKLGAKMRQQIQQLRQLNVLKEEFLSTMSHELNTPLATMKMAVKMLKQPGRSPEKQVIYLDILDKELIRESKLIKDLLKLQHFESEKFAIKPERFILNPILEKMQTDFNNRWQLLKGIELKIVFSQPKMLKKLQIETDEESLMNTLSELLVNAGKYSAANTIVQLEVEYFPKSPATIQIRVSNDGAGISEEEQEHIFEKFRRGAGVTEQAIPGTGLGLALVKALVEQLEGTIEVSSQPNIETDNYCTCFTLTFPQSMIGI